MATMWRRALHYLGLGPDDEYEDDLGYGYDDGVGTAGRVGQGGYAASAGGAGSSYGEHDDEGGRWGAPAAVQPPPPQGVRRPEVGLAGPGVSGPGVSGPLGSGPGVSGVGGAGSGNREASLGGAAGAVGRPPAGGVGVGRPQPPTGDVGVVRTIPASGVRQPTLSPDAGVRTSGAVRTIAAVSKVTEVVPEGFNDAQQVGDRFKAGTAVAMDLGNVDRELARRLIDFCSGLCYGLGGRMERLGGQRYLLSPTGVEVSADERRRLGGEG